VEANKGKSLDLTIGIDASNIRGGGGVTHLVELLRAANPADHGFSKIIVWSGSKTLALLEDRDWLVKTHDPLLDRSLFKRVCWQRFRLKHLAMSAGCDLLFLPGGTDASGFRPMVTMSRNLLPFKWREMLRYGVSLTTIRLALLRITQTRTFRKADGVIFLTQYAREAVLKVTGSLAGKIAVVSHGIHSRFRLPPRPQRSPREFTEKDPCRILYVSIIDQYKHQWYVAEAVARLRSDGLAVLLELIGPAYGPSLRRLRRTLASFDSYELFIRYLGAVDPDKLHERYKSADVGVFASSCENMPNILLEGMACGLPIACSKCGPMPEVLGGAGVYFGPESPAEIADALRQLILSPELRQQKAQRAFERAQQFSWTLCSEETFGFLRKVIVENYQKTSTAI
jgi:glycosyltransferase involved in cell wall biosynthesis